MELVGHPLADVILRDIQVPVVQGQSQEALAKVMQEQLLYKENTQQLTAEFDRIHNSLSLDFNDKATPALGKLLNRKNL